MDAAVDFTHIYDLVENLYCEDNGRPSFDPVVLFKLVLIRHLFGIRLLRQTVKDAEVNVVYCWFLGYTMSQPLPHFATISYAFCRCFTAEVIEGLLFQWVLEEVAREYDDCILCPQNQVLSYATTNREGYREYKSKSCVCKSCPVRERCTQS